jgi:hypothetical protein
VLYQTSVYCYFWNNLTVQIFCIDFCSAVQHVSPVCFSHLQVGILVHRKSKRREARRYSGCKSVLQFIIIIIPKME